MSRHRQRESKESRYTSISYEPFSVKAFLELATIVLASSTVWRAVRVPRGVFQRSEQAKRVRAVFLQFRPFGNEWFLRHTRCRAISLGDEQFLWAGVAKRQKMNPSPSPNRFFLDKSVVVRCFFKKVLKHPARNTDSRSGLHSKQAIS